MRPDFAHVSVLHHMRAVQNRRLEDEHICAHNIYISRIYVRVCLRRSLIKIDTYVASFRHIIYASDALKLLNKLTLKAIQVYENTNLNAHE